MPDQFSPKTIVKLTDEEYSLISKLKKLYKKLSQLSHPEVSNDENQSDNKEDVEQRTGVKDGL